MGGYSLLTQEAQPSISNLGTMKKPAPVSALPSPSTCSNSCSPFFSSACPLTHGPPNPFLLLTFLSPILAASSPTSPLLLSLSLSLPSPGTHQPSPFAPSLFSVLPLTLSSLSPVTIRSNMSTLQTSTPRMPRPHLVIPTV